MRLCFSVCNRRFLTGVIMFMLLYPMSVFAVQGQIAVQGPEAEQVVTEVLGIECAELVFYTFKTVGDVIISRTGYTGEDGFEIYGSDDYIR